MKCLPAAVACLTLFVSVVHAEDSQSDWPHRWVTSLATGGQKVFAGASGGLLLRESNVVAFSAGDLTKTERLYTHPVSVWKVTASADGSTVASTDYKGNLAIHDVASGKTDMKEVAFERWTRAMAIVQGGKQLVAGNEAGKVFVYSLEKDEVTKSQELKGQQIYDIAFSPDGNFIAASDGAGHVHLLKFPNLEAIKEVKCGEAPIWSVCFAADGKSVYAGSADRKLRHLQVEGEQEAREIGKASDWITAIARASNGDLALGTMNGMMYTHSATGFESVGKSPSGLWSVVFAGGKLLAATRKNMVAAYVPSWKFGYAAADEVK